jgi:small subunit ribosomal protein S21
MPGIVVMPGEDFESAYRRFKRQVDRNLIIVEVRKRRFYEPPSERRKREKIAIRKKILRKLWMLRRYESRL